MLNFKLPPGVRPGDTIQLQVPAVENQKSTYSVPGSDLVVMPTADLFTAGEVGAVGGATTESVNGDGDGGGGVANNIVGEGGGVRNGAGSRSIGSRRDHGSFRI